MKLRYTAPFDWDALVSFLARRAIRGVEWCEERSYARTVRIGNDAGVLRVVHDAASASLRVTIAPALRAHRAAIESKVRAMFDLDADPAAIHAHFEQDELLRDVLHAHPGVRVPGAWDPFEIAMRAIVGQQISVTAAISILTSMTERFGETLDDGTRLFPTPAQLANADLAGMPRVRLDTIRAVATAFAERDITSGDDLLSIRGIGPWTASYVSMRAFGDRDAFPAGDLVLRKAAGAANARELTQRAEAWRPYRAYATILLWMR
ncbi:MAG TPA: AlkA N-terminal domain-containing protein [Thermoanaerobaculia bacterium]|nr:AlkA N-terminal domain-containing protein [Thermoanaerobaculia bacterium]